MPAILLHGFEHTPNHCQQQQRKQKKRARHHCANNHSPRHSQLPGRLILACQAVFAQLLVHTLHDAYNQLLLIASVFRAALIVYETLALRPMQDVKCQIENTKELQKYVVYVCMKLRLAN